MFPMVAIAATTTTTAAAATDSGNMPHRCSQWWLLFLAIAALTSVARGGCPFQNPFWFLDTPSVVKIMDENGEMIPNQARVSWGLLKNFQCVDYFQVEYFDKKNPGNIQLSERINRHRRSVDIDVDPCTEYSFKVIASEDWKGMREDFKMASDTITFRVEYSPKFINPPLVKEIRRRLRPPAHAAYQRPVRSPILDEVGQEPTEPPPPEPEVPFIIRVSWKLVDIDFPMCLSHFVFDYYDTVYNESVFSQEFRPPFDAKIQFELSNDKVPCHADFAFIARVYGFIDDIHTIADWTPKTCWLPTTLEPQTTTTEAPTTVDSGEEALYEAKEKNAALKAKIQGLKQQYGPIGKQVYAALKEHIFLGLEGYMARKKTIEGLDIGELEKLGIEEGPF